MLETVSDQPHIAKNVAYELPDYSKVWILLRQRPFIDKEFGQDYLDLFGNTFQKGLVLYGSQSNQLTGFHRLATLQSSNF